MKKLDREDILLIIASLITGVGFILCLVFGFNMYCNETKWNDLYLIMTISVAVLFIFSFLSLIMKKIKERREKTK